MDNKNLEKELDKLDVNSLELLIKEANKRLNVNGNNKKIRGRIFMAKAILKRKQKLIKKPISLRERIEVFNRDEFE